MTTFPVGSKVRFFAKVTLATKPHDADKIAAIVTMPRGKTTYSPKNGIVHDGEGAYHVDHEIEMPGTYTVRFTIDGEHVGEQQYLAFDGAPAAVQAQTERMLERPPALPPKLRNDWSPPTVPLRNAATTSSRPSQAPSWMAPLPNSKPK